MLAVVTANSLVYTASRETIQMPVANPVRRFPQSLAAFGSPWKRNSGYG